MRGVRPPFSMTSTMEIDPILEERDSRSGLVFNDGNVALPGFALARRSYQ